jgi:hypothetical protein
MLKTEAELLFLRNQVGMYVEVYQDEGTPNLLVKFCEIHQS